MYKFSDDDINHAKSGYVNKDCDDYTVWIEFREPVYFAAFEKQDLLYLLSQIEEAKIDDYR